MLVSLQGVKIFNCTEIQQVFIVVFCAALGLKPPDVQSNQPHPAGVSQTRAQCRNVEILKSACVQTWLHTQSEQMVSNYEMCDNIRVCNWCVGKWKWVRALKETSVLEEKKSAEQIFMYWCLRRVYVFNLECDDGKMSKGLDERQPSVATKDGFCLVF